MAWIETRGDTWRTCWRLRGGDKSGKQVTTWPDPAIADQAKRIAEAHDHKITARRVYATILGTEAVDDPGRRGDGSRTPLVRDFADTWLASRTRLSPGQVARYRSQLDREILVYRHDGGPAIGDKQLHEITGTDVAGLLNDLRTRFKDPTVTRYYSCMHAMFAFALIEGIIPDNPARRTDFIRDVVAHDDDSDEGDDHVYLEMWEFELIVANLPADARPLAEFLAGTGCRFGEATAVAADKLDRKARTVSIHRAWKNDGAGTWYLGATKGRRRRKVTVDPSVLAAVPSGAPVDGLLFRSPRGNRIDHSNWVERRWNPAVAAAMRCADHPPSTADRKAVSGCECPTRLKRRPTVHDLRHSHVAWLIAEGQPLTAISRRLGHHSITVTERVYAGILPEVSDALAAAYGRRRAGIPAATRHRRATTPTRRLRRRAIGPQRVAS